MLNCIEVSINKMRFSGNTFHDLNRLILVSQIRFINHNEWKHQEILFTQWKWDKVIAQPSTQTASWLEMCSATGLIASSPVWKMDSFMPFQNQIKFPIFFMITCPAAGCWQKCDGKAELWEKFGNSNVVSFTSFILEATNSVSGTFFSCCFSKRLRRAAN